MVDKSVEDVVNDFKKSDEFHYCLNEYSIGIYKLACTNIKTYVKIKNLSLDISFIDVVKNAFVRGEELDFISLKVS